VKLLREPLVHFLLFGAALFLLSNLMSGSSRSSGPGSNEIVVSQGQIASLIQSWQLVWQRPPTESELQGLIQDYVREEVLYREAVAMGLDKDDTVIRRRLRQKMEFLADDTAEIAEPTDDDLEVYLREHTERFAVAPRVSFQQVFVSRDRHGDRTEEHAEDVLKKLRAGGSPEELSDPLLLPDAYDSESPNEVGRTFGDAFSRSLFELAPGPWTGPIESGYGLHLVRVRARDDGRSPKLAEVRDDVAREWMAARRKETNEKFYEALRDKYSVRIEPVPPGTGDPAQASAR
jgi:PPIC-type PPIASE domain